MMLTKEKNLSLNFKNDQNIKIVQCSDQAQTMDDGSRVIYAESDQKLVLYQKKPNELACSYVFDRQSGLIYVNGKKGKRIDKQDMLNLGVEFMSQMGESQLLAIRIGATAEKS